MLNVPNFPTDNLYKFIAISGIMLFLVAVFYPEYRRTEIRNEITLYNSEIKKLSIEESKAKIKLDEIKNELDELEANINIKKSTVNDSVISRVRVLSGKKEIVDLSHKIDRLIYEWKDINREIELKSIEINTKSQLIDDKNSDIKVLDDAANILGPFSMLVMTLGFILWYEKTQKLQDKVLAEQAGNILEEQYCQSCGMILKHQPNYSNFSDLEKKLIYCNNCHSQNDFIEPDLTFEEMKMKVKNRCKELKFGKIKTSIIVNRLYGLERWKDKFNW